MADYTGLGGSYIFGVSATTGAKLILALTDNGNGTGSISGGGGGSTVFPFAGNADAQAPSSQGQGLAIFGFDGTNFDRVRVANAGTQIAGGTPGVLVVQGTGTGGAIPITGTISASTTFPYSFTADAQTATTASAIGLVGFNGTSVDRLRVGPAGTAITAATAGVPYVQGIGTAGAMPISGAVSVSNFPATQPVSGTVAATQSGTWNVGLSTGANVIGSIANTAFGITGALPTGANVIGGVTQSGTWTVGLAAGAAVIGAVTQSGGPWTMNLTQVGGAAVALGQAVMASSIPVVIASNQSSLPVTVGNASIPVTQSGTWNVGLNAGTNSIGAVTAFQDNTGAQTVPGATAAGTSSTKPAVAVQGVTGGVPIPVSGTVTPTMPTSSAAGQSTPSMSTTSAVLLLANAARKGAHIANNALATLYISAGATPVGTIAGPWQWAIPSGGTLDLGGNGFIYTGVLNAILPAGATTANVTVVEFT